MNFSRQRKAAACFLNAIRPVITKTADRKTIMNYHMRGQRRKTIIDYHEEFKRPKLTFRESEELLPIYSFKRHGCASWNMTFHLMRCLVTREPLRI